MNLKKKQKSMRLGHSQADSSKSMLSDVSEIRSAPRPVDKILITLS